MKRYILIALMFISLAGFSQDNLKLDEAIKIALEKNYGVLTAKNTSKIAVNNATIGNAGLLPKLDASASSRFIDTETDSPTGKQDVSNTTNSASLNLSYTLVNGLGNVYNYKKLQLQSKGSAFKTKLILETTVFTVVQSFYGLATSQDNFKRAKEMLMISKERLVRSIAKTELGSASSLDVLNARVDFNKDSVSYINTEKRFYDSKRRLNMILSRDINTEFEVDLGEIDFKIYKLDELIKTAFEKNSDYLVSLVNLEKSNYDLKIANSTLFPTITVGTSYGYNKMNQDYNLGMNNPNAALSAELRLSWNIFDGKKKSTMRKNAKIGIENSKYKLEEQKLNIQMDISNAFATYNNNLKVLAVEKSNLKSAQMNFDQSKEFYNLGQITSTRFREAQLNLLTAKNNISAALYSAKVAEMDLNRLCGLIVQAN